MEVWDSGRSKFKSDRWSRKGPRLTRRGKNFLSPRRPASWEGLHPWCLLPRPTSIGSLNWPCPNVTCIAALAICILRLIPARLYSPQSAVEAQCAAHWGHALSWHRFCVYRDILTRALNTHLLVRFLLCKENIHNLGSFLYPCVSTSCKNDLLKIYSTLHTAKAGSRNENEEGLEVNILPDLLHIYITYRFTGTCTVLAIKYIK